MYIASYVCILMCCVIPLCLLSYWRHVPYLVFCYHYYAGAVSISEMIRTYHTLQVLIFRNNHPTGDEGIAAIAKTLDNARISKLDVCDCNITNTGAKSLAEGLINNRTIKSLNVEYNDITVDGAIVILEAAVANGVCQAVEINYDDESDSDYNGDDKVKELMSILEERKRQGVFIT